MPRINAINHVAVVVEDMEKSLSFWRDIACRYMMHLCRTPESAGNHLDPIDPPPDSEIAALQFAAPPMQGGEHLNAALNLRSSTRKAWNMAPPFRKTEAWQQLRDIA